MFSVVCVSVFLYSGGPRTCSNLFTIRLFACWYFDMIQLFIKSGKIYSGQHSLQYSIKPCTTVREVSYINWKSVKYTSKRIFQNGKFGGKLCVISVQGFIYIRAKAIFSFDPRRCCCRFKVNSKLDSLLTQWKRRHFRFRSNINEP